MNRIKLLEGLFGPTAPADQSAAMELGNALADSGLTISVEDGDDVALSAEALSAMDRFIMMQEVYVQGMSEDDPRRGILTGYLRGSGLIQPVADTSDEDDTGVETGLVFDDDEEDSETPVHEAAPARPSGAPERPARSAPPAKPAAAPKPPERLPLLPEHRNMSRVNKVFQRWRPHFLSWGIRSSGQVTSSMQSVETNLKQSPNVAGRLMQMVSTIKLIIDGHWPHSSTEFERQFGIALPDDFVSAHMPQG